MADLPIEDTMMCVGCRKPRHVQCMRDTVLAEDDPDKGYCCPCDIREGKYEDEDPVDLGDGMYPIIDAQWYEFWCWFWW